MVTPSVVDSDGGGVAAVVAWGWGWALKEKGHFGAFDLRGLAWHPCACVCMHV